MVIPGKQLSVIETFTKHNRICPLRFVPRNFCFCQHSANSTTAQPVGNVFEGLLHLFSIEFSHSANYFCTTYMKSCHFRQSVVGIPLCVNGMCDNIYDSILLTVVFCKTCRNTSMPLSIMDQARPQP